MSKRTRTPINLADTAVRLASHRELWRRLVDFDPISRYYARIASSPDHEAWLLTWLPGQGTAWHDHGCSAGSFVVLQGQLTEEVAAPARLTQRPRPSTVLVAGDQRTFGRHHVHRVTNLHIDPAVSLHVYAPKLTVMRTYVDRDGMLHEVSEEREGVSW